MQKYGLVLKTMAVLSIALGGLFSEASERHPVQDCGLILTMSGDGLLPDRMILQTSRNSGRGRLNGRDIHYVLSSRDQYGQLSLASQEIIAGLKTGEEVCLIGYTYEKGGVTVFIPLSRVRESAEERARYFCAAD